MKTEIQSESANIMTANPHSGSLEEVNESGERVQVDHLPETLDFAEGDMVPGITSEMQQATDLLRGEIRKSVEEFDPHLAKVWDALTLINDPNEEIRRNFNQLQVMINESHRAYWAGRKRDQDWLEKFSQSDYRV